MLSISPKVFQWANVIQGLRLEKEFAISEELSPSAESVFIEFHVYVTAEWSELKTLLKAIRSGLRSERFASGPYRATA